MLRGIKARKSLILMALVLPLFGILGWETCLRVDTYAYADAAEQLPTGEKLNARVVGEWHNHRRTVVQGEPYTLFLFIETKKDSRTEIAKIFIDSKSLGEQELQFQKQNQYSSAFEKRWGYLGDTYVINGVSTDRQDFQIKVRITTPDRPLGVDEVMLPMKLQHTGYWSTTWLEAMKGI